MNKDHPLAWHAALISVSQHHRFWLQDRGSLTRRIQNCCAKFCVKRVFQSLSRIYEDEQRVMGLRASELALVREVYLYCGDTPVVFAHSVVAHKDLRGAWRGLSGLGNKSLGTVLFTNPKIKRTPLEFKKISRGHFLYDRACARLSVKPHNLWARRSLFTLHGQSILVTEVFLPAILDLTL
ncbi:chorismate--pyruvate lyase family protein [Nitrosomonas supralitoralis]|uniref:Probable chorismate pyruvate-lyase n=1 Tax=Nitrosomonas supralitoralis TaxID=2116706 RepID=A0A2P7NWV8_9PROT|nr:chorismate lyase [Nitrosomonas supralitoralis]PSJ17944.1 chorismate--pyruvate lyase [Nitrosomonas supralitoralis]